MTPATGNLIGRNTMRSISKIFILLVLVTMTFACVPKSTKSTDGTTANGAYVDPNYYHDDFNDILIPKEIDFITDESYTFNNDKFRAGFMRYNGRVEMADLINFFLNNMAKDNWKQVNAVRGPISVLTFEKFNKSCVIQIQDGIGNVKVTVIAVETKDGASDDKKPLK